MRWALDEKNQLVFISFFDTIFYSIISENGVYYSLIKKSQTKVGIKYGRNTLLEEKMEKNP